MQPTTILTRVAILSLLLALAGLPVHAGQVFPPSNPEECGNDTALNWNGKGDVYCRPMLGGGSSMTWTAVDLNDTAPFDPQCDYRLKFRDPTNHSRVVYFTATINYPDDAWSGTVDGDVNSIGAVTSCLHAWVRSDRKAVMRPWGACSFAPMTEYFGLDQRCSD